MRRPSIRFSAPRTRREGDRFAWPAILACALLSTSLVGCSRLDAQETVQAPAAGEPAAFVTAAGGLADLVKLYSADKLLSSYSFANREHGAILRDGSLRGRGPNIEFGRLRPGVLSVGGSGGMVGAIMNIGSLTDVCDRAYYELTRVDDVVAHSAKDPAVGDQLFTIPAAGPDTLATEVKPGDICLLRLQNIPQAIGATPERGTAYVKLLIVETCEQQSLTFRWQTF